MNSPLATSPVPWTEWLRSESARWLFVIRTVMAMLLALLIALRFDLSSPGGAAVTVSLISLPQAGQVLEKSFYRLLGTLLGAVVTLILVATFAQHRDTFILAVALWIAMCTAASSWFRGFQAYGWLLCGYTTCLIGFPAFMDADHAFDIAIDRLTIVGVGILCAGVVSAIILPTRSTTQLVQSLRRSFIDFVDFLDAATAVGDAGAARAGATRAGAIRQTQMQFSRDLAQLETARASSFFEDPSSRIRSRRLSGYLGSFMMASSRLHLLNRQLESLRSRGHVATVTSLEPHLVAFRDAVRIAGRTPPTAADARPLEQQLSRALAAMPSITNPSTLLFDGTLIMLREAVEAALALALSYADLDAPRSRANVSFKTRLRAHSDWLPAALSGVRAALVVVITCSFWIASAWPEGFSMTLIGVVGCALFAFAPDPPRAALQMCLGFALGLPAVLACYSWVLPAASGFEMLALGITPFLVFGAWLMTRPGQALTGSGYFLMFLTGLGLSGVMNYDFITMFNNALALFVGIGVAALSLAVLAPGDRAWRPARAQRHLFASLGLARRARLTGLEQRFESRVRELTLRLIELRPAGYDIARDEMTGLLVLETGDAILRVRRHVAPLPRSEQTRLASLLDDAVRVISGGNADALRLLVTDIAASIASTGAFPEDPAKDSATRTARLQVVVGLRTLRLAAESAYAP